MLKRTTLNFAKNYANTLQTSVELCPKIYLFPKVSPLKSTTRTVFNLLCLKKYCRKNVSDCIDHGSSTGAIFAFIEAIVTIVEIGGRF